MHPCTILSGACPSDLVWSSLCLWPSLLVSSSLHLYWSPLIVIRSCLHASRPSSRRPVRFPGHIRPSGRYCMVVVRLTPLFGSRSVRPLRQVCLAGWPFRPLLCWLATTLYFVHFDHSGRSGSGHSSAAVRPLQPFSPPSLAVQHCLHRPSYFGTIQAVVG